MEDQLYYKTREGNLVPISLANLLLSLNKCGDVYFEKAHDDSWVNICIRDDDKKVDISLGIQDDKIVDVGVYKTPIKKVEGEQKKFI